LKKKYYNILSHFIAASLLFFSFSSVSAQAPVANFTGNPLAGCSPVIINFQDLSTGNPTSWSWNFGNGNTSVLQNPTASYFTPGAYTISLTVTNANGSNTLTRTQYINVYEPPTVDFSGSPLSGCFPLRVQFTDMSQPGLGNTNVSWFWDFGNGTTSTLQNPMATFVTTGNFTITLRVTNDKGCTRTISRPNYITATTGVVAGFTHTQATVCSAPATIDFTNTSTGPPTLSYVWDFGDGSPFSGVTNPTHTYLVNGTFIATLITTSTAGCVDTFRSNPIVIGGFVTDFNSPASVCINEAATFTNTSTPVPISSFWTFGDGGTANTINATYSYAAPGTYNVWLYNTYSSCIDSIPHTITVNPRPVSDFSAPITSRCEPPLTVNFQDLSTGTPLSWQWDFGDGNTSTLQNPSHTYTSYGSFTVTLITTNGFGCTDTIVRTNYIDIRRASISIPLFPLRGCIPYSISPVPVISSVDAVTSYNWDFGDGGTSTLPNPTYTYIAQGTYTVRLIITTSTGCTDTLIIPNAVRVGSKPVADFSAAPIPVCGTQPVYFTNLTVPSDEWLWDFGDGGSSTLQNPQHSYSDTGYFSIRLIATNNGCPDTLIRTNYVRVLPPIARFTPVPNCTNRLEFSFTDQSIAPLTWEWNFGDGSPVSTIQNPTHIFPSYGNFTIQLIVTNGGCADTIQQTIRTVDESPDFNANILSACKIATIDFTATNVIAANIASYFWDFGDGSTISTTSLVINHIYLNSGTYTVTLTTTDINGCIDVVTKNNYIRINGSIANFSATNASGCTGLNTTFNDLSTTDGVNAITNWQWDFGDGTIQNFSAPPFQHTYNTVGSFTVKLIITDAAGCMDSLSISNQVNTSNPIPDFVTANTLTCPNATVTFTNTTTPTGLASEWDFGDGGTSTIYSPTYIYTASGLYTVRLRVQDIYGCADSIIKTSYVRVDVPVADFIRSDSASSCTPFEVQFTNTSTYFTSVLWNFGPGEGTSNLSNPVHFYNLPGIYPVKLLITSPGGCLDSIIKNIYVYDTVGSVLNYTPTAGCSPFPASFNIVNSGPVNSYFWDFGDGNTAITTTPTINHTYTNFGNFVPKVILEDPSGCLILLQGVDTFYITGAKADFGFDSLVFCDIGFVNFSDSTTFNDPIVSYSWDFGDGGTSALQNPSHQYSSPGLYTVQLAVQTQLGCTDTLTRPNLVKVVQRPLIDIAGDSVVCVNSSLLHAGIFLQPDTSIVTWQWNFPNGNTSILQNPSSQTYTTAGTFSITAIATNSTGCRDTTQQTVYINPLPVVNMPGQLTVQNGFPVTLPATYSPNTISWIWSPATGLSCANCPTPDIGPKFSTFYQVYFTDDNGCSNIGQLQVTVICNNSNLFIPNTFSPNGDGSNDIFYPRGKGLERIKTFRIFNRWGEVVFEKRDFPINDASAGWNGTYKGTKPKADVYVYQAEVFCENGEIIKLNGNIALIL